MAEAPPVYDAVQAKAYNRLKTVVKQMAPEGQADLLLKNISDEWGGGKPLQHLPNDVLDSITEGLKGLPPGRFPRRGH
jgi:hypothetical protein